MQGACPRHMLLGNDAIVMQLELRTNCYYKNNKAMAGNIIHNRERERFRSDTRRMA